MEDERKGVAGEPKRLVLVAACALVDADGRALTQVEGTTAADAHVE